MRIVVPIAFATALAACAGPRPAAPGSAAVVPPSVWRGGAMAASDPISAQWWSAYRDPVLANLIETALANNVDIAIAASRVDEARAQFRIARGQQGPIVTAGATGGTSRSVNAFGQGVDQSAVDAEARASFDLDLFGRLAKASAAARAQLLASEDSRDTVRLAVATSVASGYVGLRSLDARLGVLRDTLTARASSLRLARRRAGAGYASKLDLAQAEAEYAATEQLIPAAELAVTRQENGLSILLGCSPGAIERGADLDGIALPAPPALLPANVLRRRPDVAAAEQQIVAADRSLDSARAAFMPNVQLSSSGGFVASTLLADPISIFALGGSALAPLFESGRLRAQADVAAARRDQAAFGYRRAALNAFREVEDALASVERAGEQERALTAQRDALARTLAFASNRYREGYSPYLELLDAQRALLSAQLSLVQSRADRLTASISLYQAYGGGWRSAAQENKEPAE